ncbi:sensor histidine kinase [Cryptosporangium phraense]|uniref:Sensor histidine kinase n=1 Tax=Cryptosporangium phraense TaxID=2593070 RepID=A0A545AIB2_9ACTN|nr:sensor histidine kinase [Cryptosporangium phraense]TQS41053.1 sensor histidine kinase [Cryptosporangium phraense]
MRSGWAIGALPGGLCVAGLVLLWTSPPPPELAWSVVWALVTGSGFAAAATTVLALRPSSGPGRAMFAGALLLLAAPLGSAAGLGRLTELLLVGAAALVLPLALMQVVPRRRAQGVQRALDLVVGVGGVATLAAIGFRLGPAGFVTAGVVGVGLFCAGWLQFELTSGDERRQVLWLILGVAAALPTTFLFDVLADSSSITAEQVAVGVGVLNLALPLSAAIALLAPRWTDVRTVISHAVTGVTMVVLAVAVYAGGESVLRLLAGGVPPLSARAVLAAAVAAGFHPARVRVRAAVDELLFGGRSDPVDALTRLGSELTAGSPPTEWLETLRSALAVPGLVIRREDDVVAAAGEVDPERCLAIPLRAGPEHVGDLVVGVPPDQLGPTAATRDVLALVAAPLAQALHAARLSEQLRISRGQVVAALEEERRRVRRDLHDGLGPALTGIAYSADAARNLVTSDAGQAGEILRELRADVGEAIAEVRRIVYGMRPRALDELGLVEAVRQRSLHLPGTDGRALAVTIEAGPLPELPAAVEVAAYRVAVEALTNVSRHAEAGAARLRLAVDGRLLRLTVTDGGTDRGRWEPGVGLTSMRERVEEIGGTLRAASGPAGGEVTAEIPLDVLPAG